MPCYRPIYGYRGPVNENGKRPIVFNRRQATNIAFAVDVDKNVKLPCGQCIGCRLERSRQWAVRCVHEASLYESNCFLTLTYNDENLPKNLSLIKTDFQNFIRSLRDRIRYDHNLEENHRVFSSHHSPRYFMAGEYGSLNKRPHYHAILFNFDFPDKVLFQKSDTGDIYESKILNEIWGKGFCSIGSVTFESAAYVARYCVDKITGEDAREHYGERIPEYTSMSLKPAIGYEWLKKYYSDAYPSDQIVVRGKPQRPPKFYDKKLSVDDPLTFEYIKKRRLSDARTASESNPEEGEVTRLRVKEIVKTLTIKQTLKRSV